MAATMRTSTWIVSVPPTRSNSPSCSTRRSLAWVTGEQVADLVEEEGAAVGQLEAALLAAGRAGEGALLVAEQLGLEQGLGERRAVHRDERPARARLERSWMARATSSLPVPLSPWIEHGGRAVRHLLHERHEPAEGGARPDHVALPQQVVEALLQRAVLAR